MRRLFIIHIAFLCVIACAFCGTLWFMPEQRSQLFADHAIEDRVAINILLGITGVVGVGSAFLLIEKIFFKGGRGFGLLLLSAVAFCFMLAFNVGIGYANAHKQDQGMIEGLGLSIVQSLFFGALFLLGMKYILRMIRRTQDFMAYFVLAIDGFALTLMGFIGMWGWIPVVIAVAFFLRLYREFNEDVFEKIPVPDPNARCGGGSSYTVDLYRERDPEGDGYTSSLGH